MKRHDDMLNYLGEHYGALAWNAHAGHLFGWSGEFRTETLAW